MRRLLLLVVLAAALSSAATATSATTTLVSITQVGLVPKNVAVNAGDTVKWVNNDKKNHQVACAKCSFTSPVLTPAASYSYTFKTAGKFAITDPLSKIKGTVTVAAPTAGFTLAAKPRAVKFLAATTLSGTASTAQSGQKVSLLGQVCGTATFKQVTSTTAGTGGIFSVTQAPTMNTVYEAKVGNATSTTALVKVLPSIRLAKIARHSFRVSVTAASSFAGKYVLFQKRTAAGRWVTVKKVTLKTAATVGTTTLTKRAFTSRIQHGRRVRATMTLGQAAPCYAGSRSNVVRS
jgi:plastocyanin